MQPTLHATRPTPRGDSHMVQAMSSWSLKSRRSPSRHCMNVRVYGPTDYGHVQSEYTPHLPPIPPPLLSWSSAAAVSLCVVAERVRKGTSRKKRAGDRHACGQSGKASTIRATFLIYYIGAFAFGLASAFAFVFAFASVGNTSWQSPPAKGKGKTETKAKAKSRQGQRHLHVKNGKMDITCSCGDKRPVAPPIIQTPLARARVR